MGNYTNEKSLVVIRDGFLYRVKGFLHRFFGNRRTKYDINNIIESYDIKENDDDLNKNYIETVELNPPKERKLYNFDADNNDDWPGDDNNMENVDDENVNSTNCTEEKDEESLEEKYDREIYSEAYIEKQKLEQKLLNYYESIKKGI